MYKLYISYKNKKTLILSSFYLIFLNSFFFCFLKSFEKRRYVSFLHALLQYKLMPLLTLPLVASLIPDAVNELCRQKMRNTRVLCPYVEKVQLSRVLHNCCASENDTAVYIYIYIIIMRKLRTSTEHVAVSKLNAFITEQNSWFELFIETVSFKCSMTDEYGIIFSFYLY